MIIINIYWDDLSEEGKESIINAGFTLSSEVEEQLVPLGSIHVGETE